MSEAPFHSVSLSLIYSLPLSLKTTGKGEKTLSVKIETLNWGKNLRGKEEKKQRRERKRREKERREEARTSEWFSPSKKLYFTQQHNWKHKISFLRSISLCGFFLKFFSFFSRERERRKDCEKKREKREEVREGEEGNISPQETVSIFSVCMKIKGFGTEG